MPDEVDVAAWAAELDGLLARLAARFTRPEPRRRAAAYVRGLIARRDSALRRWLEARPLGYVLAVTSGQLLVPGGVRERVDEIAAALPAAWQRLSAGDGAKGPRLYDWA